MWIEGLKDLLLPRWCAVCGTKLVRGERHICTGCIKDMPLTFFWNQSSNPMADLLNRRIQEHMEGGSGGAGLCYESYSYAVALFFYRGLYRKLSQSVKYDADLALGRYLGQALGRKLSDSAYMPSIDIVVPVPLHKSRQRHRGYNQAAVLAGEIASVCGCRMEENFLERVTRTASQATISKEAKAANVKGAFMVSKRLLPVKKPGHILLVDDVFTTGSTLCECHRALREALVETYGYNEGRDVRISVATLAFVGQ